MAVSGKQKLVWLAACLVLVLTLCGCATNRKTPATPSGAQQEVLLTLQDGETIPYEPYRLYLNVSGGISEYSARQGIAFTRAMESYLNANNVILAQDEFLALCEEDMNDYLSSDMFVLCSGLLTAHYGMTQEDVVRCVWENYWSQYVARALSGFYNAQESMGADPADTMFDKFTEEFYTNLSFPDGCVACFAGEEIAWTPLYENMCTYNMMTTRLQTADTIAQNRCVEKYVQEQGLEVDLSTLDQSVSEAVSTMKSNEIYAKVFDSILAAQDKTLDDFLNAMRPFVVANYQRAAFGQHCYEEYAALDAESKPAAADDYYYDRLDAITQTYTINYLGW